MQVYACVYTAGGDFLLASKRLVGYYFTSTKGGVIVPEGEELNPRSKDALRYALPGGKKNNSETIEAGALREWKEETNCQFEPDNTQSMNWTAFGAGYFLVSSEALLEMRNRFADPVLPAANRAADQVRDHEIKHYAEIHVFNPQAPADNELAALDRWSVITDWQRIEEWEGDKAVGWFFTILQHLRTTILAS